jgi:hypothetical protein
MNTRSSFIGSKPSRRREETTPLPQSIRLRLSPVFNMYPEQHLVGFGAPDDEPKTVNEF